MPLDDPAPEPGGRRAPSTRRRWAVGIALLAALVIAAAAGASLWWTTPPLDPGLRADRVTVVKRERSLVLESRGRILKRYRVSLGGSPEGRKERQGDSRTPEGVYRIDWRNPRSRFHLALHVSYPDADDRRRAARAGVDPGGDIMIHGLPDRLGWIGPLHRLVDWTDGCVAVTNAEIDEIWRAVADGTPVEIRP